MTTITLDKTSAEDYLRDYASRSDGLWFGPLVEEVISIRAVPAKRTLDEIYKRFLASQGLATSVKDAAKSSTPKDQASAPALASASHFKLTNITHKKGVNALSEGEKMSFHPKLTVVFGKNGSGKSGFVRVIKRISGSKTHESIWQNIRNSRTKDQCAADVAYNSDGKGGTYQWSGEHTVEPFNQMQVFDGKCIPLYLTKSLDFSYQPYGFELFSIVSTSLRELQGRLTNDIDKKGQAIPDFDQVFYEDTEVGRFVANLDSSSSLEELRRLPKWNSASKKELVEAERAQRTLQNIDQRRENLQNRLRAIAALQDQLEEVQKEFTSKNIANYARLIKSFNKLKAKHVTKKGKTLEDFAIPQMDTDEWQEFIDASERYVDSLHGEHYPQDEDQCIYCRQKLSKNALKLVRLYRQLFQEQETSDMEASERKLDEALSAIEGTSYADALSYEEEDFDKLLPKKQAEAAFNALRGADERINKITKCLREKRAEKIPALNIHGLIGRIERRQNKLRGELEELDELQQNLEQRTGEVEGRIAELEDIRGLVKHRKRIEKRIVTEEWVANARAANAKLNTKPVTDLGGKAWKELVSDSFKERFKDEVAGLNAPAVGLDFHGEYGSQMREKNLEGLSKIDDFLSEGEQRAVALADFFAELSMQDDDYPIVFDDPATSFDHDRKEQIAKRIATEAAKRQVIVFTHDLMFASYLYELVLDDKTRDIDKSKAAFHDLTAEGGMVGIVTENYYRGSVKLNSYLPRIENKIKAAEPLRGGDRNDAIKAVYGMLRTAVEKVVEERIFGSIITRWTDRIQLMSESNATLDREKLKKAKELHATYSRYIDGHNQSDGMIHHALPNMDKLKTDFKEVEELAKR